MANEKPIQPPMATVDPKSLMAFSFLSTQEGQEYMRKQNELLDIQLENARESQQKIEAARQAALNSRRQMAEAARQTEAAQKKLEDTCNHTHQNGDHALRGQRMARGSGIPSRDKGRREWIVRCQLCGKAFDNTTGLPNGWTIQAEHFGGPSF